MAVGTAIRGAHLPIQNSTGPGFNAVGEAEDPFPLLTGGVLWCRRCAHVAGAVITARADTTAAGESAVGSHAAKGMA